MGETITAALRRGEEEAESLEVNNDFKHGWFGTAGVYHGLVSNRAFNHDKNICQFPKTISRLRGSIRSLGDTK